MCKHFDQGQEEIKFAADYSGIENPPRPEDVEEVWPRRKAVVLTQTDQGKAMVSMRWAVWPFYAREKPEYLHNARDDSLLTKSTWKQSVAKRRCLIPVRAYFETGLGPQGARGEVRMTLVNRPSYFIAGLWDRDPDGSGTQAFTMVTTMPNELTLKFTNNDRMPVVLDDADAGRWLGFEPLEPDVLQSLCRPYPVDLMQHQDIAAPPPTKKIKKADLKQETGELDLFG